MFKRIVLKLSGEYLAGQMEENPDTNKKQSDHFDSVVVERITDEICSLVKMGVEVSLVVGGGNFWRGVEAPEGMDSVRADHMGMLASVINGIYLADCFCRKCIKTHVLTPFYVGAMTELFSKESALGCLEKGEIAIFAGGTGHPFFSTDTIAAIRAAELRADCVMFAKGVEGVCDCNPKTLTVGSSYGVYREISCRKMIQDDLKVIDAVAAHILMQNKVYAVLFDIRVKGGIIKAGLANDEIFEIGTKIYHHMDKEWEDQICRKKQTLMKTK